MIWKKNNIEIICPRRTEIEKNNLLSVRDKEKKANNKIQFEEEWMEESEDEWSNRSVSAMRPRRAGFFIFISSSFFH